MKKSKRINTASVVGNALKVWQTVNEQADQFKIEAKKDIDLLLKRVGTSYKEVNDQMTIVAEVAKSQAKEGLAHLKKQWDDKKDQLPKELVKKVDGVLKTVKAKKKSPVKAKAKAKSAPKKAAATVKAKPASTRKKTPAAK